MTIHDEYFEKCDKHIKNNNQKQSKKILLMQVGNFYEAYYNNNNIGSAKDLAYALNIHLTKKNSKLPFDKKNPMMAGFPIFQLEKHLNILLDMGFTVIIYDQNVFDPKKREYKGTFTDNIRYEFKNTISTKTSKKIFSCVFKKEKLSNHLKNLFEYTLSYSYLELTTGQIFFSEITNHSYLRCLEQFLLNDPSSETLFYISNSFEDQEKKNIEFFFTNNNYLFTLIPYNKINDFSTIEQKIEKCFGKNKPKNLNFFPEVGNSLFFLLEFIESNDPSQATSLTVTENHWLSSASDCQKQLDINKDLVKELFIFNDRNESRNKQNGSTKYRSLFDLYSEFMNPMAKRKLAIYLKRPLTDIIQIQKRYKQIEDSPFEKQSFLNIIDVETLFLKWKRNNISFLLLGRLIKEYKLLISIYNSKNQLHKQPGDTIANQCLVLSSFLSYIESIWNIDKIGEDEDPSFLLKTSEEYTLWNKEFQKNLDDVLSLEKKDSSFVFVKEKDYQNSYFSITNNRWNKLDNKDHFRIIANKTNSKQIMITSLQSKLLQLDILNNKIKTYQNNLYLQNCREIFDKFEVNINTFHEILCLDSMNSVLKNFFTENNYIKPDIVKEEDSFLKLEKVRHPLLEQIFNNDLFVPFDGSLNQDTLGQLLFGLNSSGKSTYKKSIATSLYLAQCGLFVPAQKMVFSPYEALFSKLNHQDNLFLKQSLFVNELTELKYILDRVSNNKSLLLLDELFSGTEIASQFALLLAIMKEMIHKKINFIMTTHIHAISEAAIDEFGKKIKINHFKMNIPNNTLCTSNICDLYDRQLCNGSGNSIYGVEIAEKLGLNSSITDSAKEYRSNIDIIYNKKLKKKSKYNKNLIVDQCSICKSRKDLETHHILQQKNFKSSTSKIEGFDKNALKNLIVLCSKCHKDVENRKN